MIPLKTILTTAIILSLLLLLETGEGSKSSKSRKSQNEYLHPPTFFHVKHIPKLGRSCDRASPEVFFNNIGRPSLSVLYHRGQALFGILMDKIEASYNASAADFKRAQTLDNKTREEWASMAKTVSSNWYSTIDRLETEWEYFILIHDMAADEFLLPWEISYKIPLIHERLARIEYGYLMVEAVVRAGIKEIIGTLQHQLGGVIRLLEEEVAKLSNENEDVTGERLLKHMKKGFSKMKPSFATKLLEKVITRSLQGSESSSRQQQQTTFISEPLEQMAIVLHAFREKGSTHPKFWEEMSHVFEQEFGFSIKNDEEELLASFIQDINLNQDKLISLIVQIFSNSEKN